MQKFIYLDIMVTNKTFTMLKPDSVENGNIGAILEKITAAVHKERPFFGELVKYMTRGPIVAAILEKENAVQDFRTLIGATNPAEAAKGTIRNMFAESISQNAVHGSDSNENAVVESMFHFSQREIF